MVSATSRVQGAAWWLASSHCRGSAPPQGEAYDTNLHMQWDAEFDICTISVYYMNSTDVTSIAMRCVNPEGCVTVGGASESRSHACLGARGWDSHPAVFSC